MEDLWAFNEEVLARAIFTSAIPVISAVGHEIDTTISDLAADARASTPTRAGTVAVPDMIDISQRLETAAQSLTAKAIAAIELYGEKLSTILASAVFKDPCRIIFDKVQMLGEKHGLMDASIKSVIEYNKNRLKNSCVNLEKIQPKKLLHENAIKLNSFVSRADSALRAVMHSRRITITAQQSRLKAMDPKGVLQRGYSITVNESTKKLVTSSLDIKIDDILVTELKNDNFIHSRVTKKNRK